MKHIGLKASDRELLKKVEQVTEETVVHRRPFLVKHGVWPFVVFGPDTAGLSVIRVGAAEQAKIKTASVYIATVGGDHIPDSESVPIEELAGSDIPEELAGLKVFSISPLRPLSITTKKGGPPIRDAASEILDFYTDKSTAIIETPDESYWALSVLKYLDDADRFFPDPMLEDFYSRIGQSALRTRNAEGNNYRH
ncbi:MAG: hypothetical protein OEY64_01500 [Nitrospinota bacterium]|nr:hypothetical protein [Nitrospinota bacterium]